MRCPTVVAELYRSIAIADRYPLAPLGLRSKTEGAKLVEKVQDPGTLRGMFDLTASGQWKSIIPPEDHFWAPSEKSPTADHDQIREPSYNIVQLLVLNALYGDGDHRCCDVRHKIELCAGESLRLSHKMVWHALHDLETCRPPLVESRRDEGSKKRKTRLYRLKHGGGSHLKKINQQWDWVVDVIARIRAR